MRGIRAALREKATNEMALFVDVVDIRVELSSVRCSGTLERVDLLVHGVKRYVGHSTGIHGKH